MFDFLDAACTYFINIQLINNVGIGTATIIGRYRENPKIHN